MNSDGGYSSSDSDYIVEHFVQPKRVRKTVNDDSADLLGNFDEAKRQAIIDGTYVNRNNELLDQSSNNGDDDEDDDDGDEVCDFSDAGEKDSPLQEISNENLNDTTVKDSDSDDEGKQNDSNEIKTDLTKEQLAALLRGTSKTNHYVLYVTNLNFDTTKEDIQNYFTMNTGHTVKSVRIPKKRRGGYAFVEMSDIDGFHKGFQLHNTELHERKIKIQLSEGGKKKSANKKNILKQKNRKLAEMRNEQKTFTKSGKFYDKTLKKEKAKDILARKRWRKKPKPASASK